MSQWASSRRGGYLLHLVDDYLASRVRPIGLYLLAQELGTRGVAPELLVSSGGPASGPRGNAASAGRSSPPAWVPTGRRVLAPRRRKLQDTIEHVPILSQQNGSITSILHCFLEVVLPFYSVIYWGFEARSLPAFWKCYFHFTLFFGSGASKMHSWAKPGLAIRTGATRAGRASRRPSTTDDLAADHRGGVGAQERDHAGDVLGTSPSCPPGCAGPIPASRRGWESVPARRSPRTRPRPRSPRCPGAQARRPM